MHNSGALNIKYELESNRAAIGEMPINLMQAHSIAQNLGWEEYILTPYEIIEKTNKFIRGIKNHINREGFWETAEVLFQNKRANTYGKTFDRIVIHFPKEFTLSILYNMEHSGGKYVIYETSRPIALAKCRNLKAVAGFINTYEP